MNELRKISIEKAAETVRKECNVLDYGFKDIFESVEKIGYRVIRYPIGIDEFLGFALIKSSEKVIFTNSSLILSREIFSAAHELGHHRLHLSENNRTIIKDNDFNNNDESEIEANYFAACLLMPLHEVEKFTRLELKNKRTDLWDGFDIARIQTAFNVSYDMALIRLKELNMLNDVIIEKLRITKIEQTATNLLSVIGGNVNLCKNTELKKIPAEFLEWVISNFNDKLITKKSLENAFNFVNLPTDTYIEEAQPEDEDDLDDLIGRLI